MSQPTISPDATHRSSRRSFVRNLAVAAAGALSSRRTLLAGAAAAVAPTLKIRRIRYYASPVSGPMINQSANVVTIETDQGITGIGEGGSKDTMEQCAAMIIGEDASRIDHLWQLMFRGLFYPAGREKLHSIGALDLALWDIKGKAVGVPVYQLLGGLARNHVECYSTAFPDKGGTRETARACMEAGFRAFRISVADPDPGQPFNSHQIVRKSAADCREARAGVGPQGDWAIDYHTRLDLPDAIRLSTLIEDLEPYFCEDMVRSEKPDIYRQVRAHVKVPIAVGEQFGARWDTVDLIDQNLIDYTRTTLPNVGGITEYLKIAALCETHDVGLIPHFTGPISEAALVHAAGTFSGPVMMEILGAGPKELPYLPQAYDFRNGKLWPNQRPGLGVTFDAKRLPMIAEITQRRRPLTLFERPDGSMTNW